MPPHGGQWAPFQLSFAPWLVPLVMALTASNRRPSTPSRNIPQSFVRWTRSYALRSTERMYAHFLRGGGPNYGGQKIGPCSRRGPARFTSPPKKRTRNVRGECWPRVTETHEVAAVNWTACMDLRDGAFWMPVRRIFEQKHAACYVTNDSKLQGVRKIAGQRVIKSALRKNSFNE